MAYNVCETSFLYFGDERSKSPGLCDFSTNHLITMKHVFDTFYKKF